MGNEVWHAGSFAEKRENGFKTNPAARHQRIWGHGSRRWFFILFTISTGV
ncbi:hypothetical protein [Bacillus sp. ISL-57]|nr:hypothetical protein [Bacillus sp. ISL-57]MBT2717813.1 hypothetical protein [Bacillus sp. ISL-57]